MHRSRVPANATKVYSGIIYDIYQWQQELFDGSIATFEMAKRVDAVTIIPIVDDKLIVLHEEQPRNVRRISFPGGHMDPGETPQQAAERELREETGMTFKNIKLVAVDDLGSEKLDWWVYRFIATDVIEEGEVAFDPGEKIERTIIPFDEAKLLSRGNYSMSLSVMDNVSCLEDLLNYPQING